MKAYIYNDGLLLTDFIDSLNDWQYNALMKSIRRNKDAGLIETDLHLIPAKDRKYTADIFLSKVKGPITDLIVMLSCEILMSIPFEKKDKNLLDSTH